MTKEQRLSLGQLRTLIKDYRRIGGLGAQVERVDDAIVITLPRPQVIVHGTDRPGKGSPGRHRVEVPTHRICRACGIDKPIDDYPLHGPAKRIPRLRHTTCKRCRSIQWTQKATKHPSGQPRWLRNIISGVDTAIHKVPEPFRSEIRQELAARILKGTCTLDNVHECIPELLKQQYKEWSDKWQTVSLSQPVGDDGATIGDIIGVN